MSRQSQSEMTRSERVRQRREQQNTSRTKRAKKTIRYAAEAHPVTVRGNIGTPVLKRTSSRPRRKVSIPLDQKGTEMQLPAVPIINPGWRILSSLIVILTGVLLYMMMNSPDFMVAHPIVEGINNIPAGDIARAVDLIDKSVFMIDTNQLEADIAKKFPDLSEISVNVAFPATVNISAVERIPVAIWELDYQNIWTDQSGLIIPPRSEPGDILKIQVQGNLPMIVPEATGNDSDEDVKQTEEDQTEPSYVAPELLNAALELGSIAPSGSRLTYNHKDGLGWNDTRGWRVYFGTSLDNLDQKLAVYDAIVKTIEAEGTQPSMISVEHVHAPRMEQ